MDTRLQLELWYTRYSDEIYQFLVYYTRNWDVEDLVQEVFIKALKNMDRFEYRAAPKTWLLSIARNTAIDHAKKRRLLRLLPGRLLGEVHRVERSPEEVLELNEEMKQVYAAIHQLKQSYRDVLVLRGIKDLSVAETAEVLNWSEAKVNLTLHRATKALQVLLNGKERNSDAISEGVR